ncbi:DUF2938 family protein [Chitinilyticum litopenaei]|uniref:DUF2938 family protein n=1 Tax=Chitinilyticum litopenaei TaxID=1121276 RepID=UPI0004058AFD|nr:DUF2938 family protein [Chitinilyticum litopenaei]
MNTLAQVLAVGVSATLLMDGWALLLRRFGIASLSYCLIGRWLAHMPTGTFTHAHIGKAAPRRHECALGWLAHYATGMAFAALLLAVDDWFARPQPGPALLVGIATVLIPYLLMQPALGLGIAASRAPAPWAARLKSLATHTVFGTGLYLGGLLVAG